jgi:serine/threonine protein kinase
MSTVRTTMIVLNHIFIQPAQCATGTPCLDDYEFLRTLGAGANATVYLVREKHTSHLYALKAVDKFTANGRKVSTSMVINEQSTLTELNGNDFVLPLHACFHDSENFYLVTVSTQVSCPHMAYSCYQ